MKAPDVNLAVDLSGLKTKWVERFVAVVQLEDSRVAMSPPMDSYTDAVREAKNVPNGIIFEIKKMMVREDVAKLGNGAHA
jgi:hypothetical protein